jgi:hypothetical protein
VSACRPEPTDRHCLNCSAKLIPPVDTAVQAWFHSLTVCIRSTAARTALDGGACGAEEGSMKGKR